MLSVITPTHRLEYLDECWSSLKNQEGADWRWIVCPNGHLKAAIVDRLKSFNDERIQIAGTWSEEATIGYLKAVCCHSSSGDTIVELDSDDRLAPGALNDIAAARRAGAGFVYSDTACDNADGFRPYSSNGWEYYAGTIDGRSYPVVRSFPPTARSFCQIYYAPNHVRCWSREAYLKVGGHDPSLAVGDDHDLCCRTYLAGVKIARLRTPLYIQRGHSDQTSVSNRFAGDMKQYTEAAMTRYLDPLIEEEARRRDWPCYYLGGKDQERGIAVGSSPKSGVRCDWGEGFPMEDDSAGVIRVDDLHTLPRSGIVQFWNEAYRCLSHGGWLVASAAAPHGPNGEVAYGHSQDPRTESSWNPNSFWCVTKREFAEPIPELKARFEAVRVRIEYPTDQHRRTKRPVLRAHLMCVKDGPSLPGHREI